MPMIVPSFFFDHERFNWDPLRDLAVSKKGLNVPVAVRPPLNVKDIKKLHILISFTADLRVATDVRTYALKGSSEMFIFFSLVGCR